MIFGLPRRTLVLILLLIGVVALLLYISLHPSGTLPGKNKLFPPPPPPVSQAKTMLAFSPSVLNLPATSSAVSLDIIVDTSSNKVSGAQLDLSYDPTVLSNVVVTPGPFLENATPLINNSDPKTGKVSYGFVLPLGITGKSGTGVLAKVNATVVSRNAGKTTIAIFPSSKVTASGISPSVLLKATNADIVFSK